ncbi:MAG: OmpA family protein, partial [Sulfitobacter sp.]
LVAANFSVTLIEENSEFGVREALDKGGLSWAEVEANGLQVTLAGTAPTEALRFQALTTAGSIVDTARVIDEMEVEAAAEIKAPRFSVEILRNDAGLSIIGLIPTSTDRASIVERFDDLDEGNQVTDLLEMANYQAPNGWEEALFFAVKAVEELPRAKVSVRAGQVDITAIAQSTEEKAAMEKRLTRLAPSNVQLTMDIAAPRPVITPFTLRFVRDDQGAHFDACSADTKATETRILSAAAEAGLTGPGTCTVGMGVPSPKWVDAVEQSIKAVTALGHGSVTISNADITLVAAEGTDQAEFDRVIGELEADLPEVFAVHAKLPLPQDVSAGPTEFVATLSPEGQVQLRGRLADENMRNIATSYAQARFGSDRVYSAARIVPDMPDNWALRVLAGIEALSMLSNGAITVTPETVSVTGNTGDQDAQAKIASLLAEKLGEAEDFSIKVKYQEKLDPVAGIPTAEECITEIDEILVSNKISFEPGNATIDASALGTMDDIAELLKLCGDLRLEIQGHTDSQGREEMNLSLSQARAQSVLNELRARRVLTSSFRAQGYGETQPIADNKTEDGREANRRIEFR